MLKKGLIEKGETENLQEAARGRARDALRESTVMEKPSIDYMFKNVYNDIPTDLE